MVIPRAAGCRCRRLSPQQQLLLVFCILSWQLASSAPAPTPSASAPTKCWPPDRAALQEFTSLINSSFFESYWPADLDSCSWPGVSCGTEGVAIVAGPDSDTEYSRVVELDLRGLVLVGRIPSALCRLSALQLLDLSPNKFPGGIGLHGSIPSCIGDNLTSLEDLLLSYNALSGSIPQSFARLTRLQSVQLRSNLFLTGSISPIANLSSLSFVDLSGNNFTGSLPLFKTPSLLYLDLSSNDFSGSIPSFNATSANLQTIRLSLNKLLIGSTLSAFPSLVELDLDETSFAAPRASGISSFFCDQPALESLSIAGSYFTSRKEEGNSIEDQAWALNNYAPSCNRPSENLTLLDLTSNDLTGPFPAWISRFLILKDLYLSDNNFSGSIPPEWQALTRLRKLDLSADSPLTSHDIPAWIFRLPLNSLTLTAMGLTMRQGVQCQNTFALLNLTLDTLDLSHNHLADGLDLLRCFVYHNFTPTFQLYLSDNPLAFTLDDARSLPLSFPILDLSFCEISGDLTMEMLSSAYYLVLANNYITGGIPSRIASLGMQIQWLDLSFNNLTGPIPFDALSNLTSAGGLLLNNNDIRGDIVIKGVGADQFSGLKLLDLAYNQFSSAVFIDTHFPSLQALDLSHNRLAGDLHQMLGDFSVLANLKLLLLDHNELTGSVPDLLGKSAPLLTGIDLSHNNLTGGIPSSLAFMPAFRSYEVDSVDPVLLNDYLVRGSIGVNNLWRYRLDLSSNMLNGSIPEALGDLQGLSDLNLSANVLSGAIPASFGNLSHLQTLDLSYNNLSGSVPEDLSKMSALQVFNVSFNPALNGQIPEGSPQLENANSYLGDPNLCGYQVHKKCNGSTATANGEGEGVQKAGTKAGYGERIRDWIEDTASVPGIFVGYGLGFGVTVLSLRLFDLRSSFDIFWLRLSNLCRP